MSDPTISTPAEATEAGNTPFRRVIKSYVLRAGRMGPGQTRAFAT